MYIYGRNKTVDSRAMHQLGFQVNNYDFVATPVITNSAFEHKHDEWNSHGRLFLAYLKSARITNNM